MDQIDMFPSAAMRLVLDRPTVRLLEGDSAKVCDVVEPNSIDSIVTDPPAGISFMGAEWDGDKGGREAWINWLAGIMRNAIQVLKPGGHALVWAIPRTSHWTATALELAGFEIRDVVMHLFGTGFPKSLDVSKAIDARLGADRDVVGKQDAPGDMLQRMSVNDKPREDWGGAGTNGSGWSGEVLGGPVTNEAKLWDGWGTALKPAAEHWILARKPMNQTVAANVLQHGTGGLNIDGCRIGSELMDVTESDGSTDEEVGWGSAFSTGRNVLAPKVGRWPANVTTDEEVAAMIDGQSGMAGPSSRPVVSPAPRARDGGQVTSFAMQPGLPHHDGGGASRFFYCAKGSRSEKDAGLDHLRASTGGEATDRVDGSAGLESPRAGAGRTGGARNTHPTVKSIALMRWLVRLVTPPGGVVLDLFMGSGTTGVAALVGGFRFVGIEQSRVFAEIAKGRLEHVLADIPLWREDCDVEDQADQGDRRQLRMF